jgi:hypothetical protein
VELGDGDPMNAFEAELRTAAECVRENRESEILGGDLARDAIRLCQMQAKSMAGAA